MLTRRLVAVGVLLGALWLAPPAGAPEGCGVFDPEMPQCEYEATEYGGLSGYGAEPGGWTVKIERKREQLVISSTGGFEFYACGTITPGDSVTVTARPGSWVTAGNPGICF